MRHHYVPQFLLKSWAASTSDDKIEVFRLDLPNVPSKRHTPEYTACEDDLYALTMSEVAGMKKQAIEERILKDIDNRGARVLQKLMATGLTALSLDDRMDWTRFLMSLRVRQPNFVQQFRIESSKQLEASLRDTPEDYEAIAEHDNPPTLEEWVRQTYPGLIENFGLTFFHELVDNPKIGDEIMRMKWWLWDFGSEKNELLVADPPCIFTSGIDHPELVIALPIGPFKAFMATKTARMAKVMRQQCPKHLLTRLNEFSLNQAQVRIYSRDTSPRRFICNRVR